MHLCIQSQHCVLWCRTPFHSMPNVSANTNPRCRHVDCPSAYLVGSCNILASGSVEWTNSLSLPCVTDLGCTMGDRSYATLPLMTPTRDVPVRSLPSARVLIPPAYLLPVPSSGDHYDQFAVPLSSLDDGHAEYESHARNTWNRKSSVMGINSWMGLSLIASSFRFFAQKIMVAKLLGK